MYYCPDCGYEFEKPDKILEKHGLPTPPYEKFYVCPDCKSTNFYEKTTTHCRCCGAKLSENRTEYCSKSCKEKGEKIWNKERKRRRILANNPINEIVKELEIYNKEHGTFYSYGQYIAIIKPKMKAEKKCEKKRKNT